MRLKCKWGIADVVVLVGSILFGALVLVAMREGSGRHAKELGCMSNLRQWGPIFQGYVQRNDGKFISSRVWYWIRELDDKHKDRHQMKIWLCPSADMPLMDKDRNPIPGDPAIFRAWGIYTGREYGPTGLAGSFGLNGYTLDCKPGTIFERGVHTSWNWRSPNVKGAASVPMFGDALRFDLWPQATESPPEEREHAWTANHMTRCCIDRHKGAVNYLFMDWSVRRVGLKELWTLKWHRQFDTAGPWTKAGGVQPTEWPKWMRGYKDF